MVAHDLWRRKETRCKRLREKEIIDPIRKPISDGLFTYSDMTYKDQKNVEMFIKFKENKLFLTLKRSNIKYTLSIKDIEFILNAMTRMWSCELGYCEIKNAKGKRIKVLCESSDEVEVKSDRLLGLTINSYYIFLGDKHDARRFYAMLKELMIYKVTNKLERI